MNKLFPIVLALLFFGCDEDPTAPAVGCDNGAEYSEAGYYCDDWQFVEDLFNCSGEECLNYLFNADAGTGMGGFTVDWMNGRIFRINLNLSPTQLVSVPESIGNLTYLQFLIIAGNQLASLHYSICNLPNLQYIEVDSNNLCEEYHYDCISYWGQQDQSNCCEGPNDEPNWTECAE